MLGDRQTTGRLAGRASPLPEQCGVEMAVDDGGMDVAVPADRPRVAEVICHRVDDLVENLDRRCLDVLTRRRQPLGCEDCRVPRPKRLRRHTGCSMLSQICVDVARRDPPHAAVRRPILEQVLAW